MKFLLMMEKLLFRKNDCGRQTTNHKPRSSVGGLRSNTASNQQKQENHT